MTASALQPEAKTLQPRHRSVMRPVVDPARTMARIRARIAETAPEDARLRVLLVLAHEVLRLGANRRALPRGSTRTPLITAPWTPPIPGASKQEYSGLVPRIRELVGTLRAIRVERSRHEPRRRCTARPAGRQRAPISPRDKRGAWAGFHPADSESAIAHLEALRAEGAEFILFPGTAYWWFDYYGELSRHLLTRSRVVHHDNDCVIFDLRVEDGKAAA